MKILSLTTRWHYLIVLDGTIRYTNWFVNSALTQLDGNKEDTHCSDQSHCV